MDRHCLPADQPRLRLHSRSRDDMVRMTTIAACAAALLLPGAARAQLWNSAGLEQSAIDAS
jgi:hypothetical protein